MHQTKSIQELLKEIRHGEILLPEFQRGYVWNRDQARGLMESLYREHPTGHLLVWSTRKPSPVRNVESPIQGQSLLLLDGQQRLTTLYVLFVGEAPSFYEGESLFFDLYFNVQTEEFRFWEPSRMATNPAWIGVHELLKDGLPALLAREDLDESRHEMFRANVMALVRLDGIRNYAYMIELVTGDEFSVDEVGEIFNRVNSRGTPLTKADLALAHICALWPEARGEVRSFQAKMAEAGFSLDLNHLVRCLAGLATGSVLLEDAFLKTSATEFQSAWERLGPALEDLTSILRHEAYVGGLRDLPNDYVLVPVTIYLATQGGRFPSDAIKRRFIRWIFLAGLWARYGARSEARLQQDVELVAGRDVDPTHELEAEILGEQGRLDVEAADLDRAQINSTLALLARVAARSRGARDWFTGSPVYDSAAGRSYGEVRHYIFPKSVLRKSGFTDENRMDALANRAELGSPPPGDRRDLSPAEYLPEVEEQRRGALKEQAVPRKRELWEPESFLDFMAERRRLLARAMNEFLKSWTRDIEVGVADEGGVRRLMADGEGDEVEFKSSLRWDRQEEKVNRSLETAVVKTVAGFLNGRGGTLLVGVNDSGAATGISRDYGTLRKKDRDGFELHLRQIVDSALGEAAVSSFLTVNFHEIDGEEVCQVTVEPSDHPIYVEDPNRAIFYVRSGNATRALPVKEAVAYVGSRWGQAT